MDYPLNSVGFPYPPVSSVVRGCDQLHDKHGGDRKLESYSKLVELTLGKRRRDKDA